MIRFFKFHRDLFPLTPAREIIHKPGKGKGWPEECPPIRAANGFGFDILANFDLDFRFAAGQWSVHKPITVESDFTWSPDRRTPGTTLHQDYAWFWEKGQQLPHVISDNVYEVIKHQVKVSSFLYLATEPNEMLLLTDVPNTHRPFRAVSAFIETDWYPANYPWHCVLELDPAHKKILIPKGTPICRIIPLERRSYDAKPMNAKQFDQFFTRGQDWLKQHGRPHDSAAAAEGTLDITRTYVKQQKKCPFTTHDH